MTLIWQLNYTRLLLKGRVVIILYFDLQHRALPGGQCGGYGRRIGKLALQQLLMAI